MQTIMLMNAKGGSGKSTIVSNIAAHYAMAGHKVYVADFDQQGSTMDWLSSRPDHCATVGGVHAATRSLRVPRDTDYVIMDAPGAIHGRAIDRLVRKVETLLIPVSPSPVDIRATARFVEELLLVRRISREKTKVGVIANRVRSKSESFEALMRFLDRLSIPVITQISDHEHYMKASGLGLSIFELENADTQQQQDEWQPLFRWLSGIPEDDDRELLASLGHVAYAD